ncbi:GNAT family N-acetyltransferase [Thioclava litoralis]|uniref:GNAT family N-acetyltransferase n=1 Tax=Thioclava litoralis TaxID=3076557 RepID=A0ABZ1E429_9RHOB|nr:GNAT family N-acetyltransferase [Thioclava sp. FTW29]
MIRPATPEDEAAIRACAIAAYTPYIARMGRDPAPMSADYAAQIAQGVVHVAYDGAFLGFITFYDEGPHILLENVAVTEAARGRGTGRKLIAFCEEAARLAGKPVQLYTNAKMTENLAIYPRLGYAMIGERVENGFHRVYFQKNPA